MLPKTEIVVFVGVVSIGKACLDALLDDGVNVVGIVTADYTQPDYFVDFSVDGIPLYYDINVIKEIKPDIVYCIGWPNIIKEDILQVAPVVGIHPTMLPERRGGAPLNWSLIDGLTRSGVTLFYMDKGIDSGDIIAQHEFDIDIKDTAGTLLDKVTDIAVELVRDFNPNIRTPQDDAKATYTRRRTPEDGRIDWRQTSLSIYNLVRAVSYPFSGALCGNKIVWSAKLVKGYKPRFRPGEVLETFEDSSIVATDDGCILIDGVFTKGVILE